MTYVGEWKYGDYNGKGKYVCTKRNYEYEGEYLDGKVPPPHILVSRILLPMLLFRNTVRAKRS